MVCVWALLFFVPTVHTARPSRCKSEAARQPREAATIAVRANSFQETLTEIDPVQCAQHGKQELRQFLRSEGVDVPVLCNRVKGKHESTRLPGLNGFIHEWKHLPGMCKAYKSAHEDGIFETISASDLSKVVEWANKFNAELMTGEDAICPSDSDSKPDEDSPGRPGPVRLEPPSMIHLKMQANASGTSGRQWCDWTEAGWDTKDLALAKKETVDEFNCEEFQMMLLQKTVKSGIECCTSYNNQLQMFQKPDSWYRYLDQSKYEPVDGGGGCKAIFVLGPSASGKTSIAASLGRLRSSMAYQFPAMTFDGADVREVSAVWNRYAQVGGSWEGSHKDGSRHWVPDRTASGCLLSKYFDEVARPNCRHRQKELMLTWVAKYKPKTVLIPETAVPCLSTLSEVSCKILKTINELKKLGYTAQFVVVYAPAEQVEAAGMKRALTEGKPYSSRGYALALQAAEALYKKFGKNSEFIFVDNTYRTNQLPDEMSWATFQQKASAAVKKQIADVLTKPFQSLDLGLDYDYDPDVEINFIPQFTVQ